MRSLKRLDMHEPTYMRSLKRGGPATIHPKDLGLILGYTNIDKESRVLEIGSGSGFTTVALARIVSEVISYEKRSEFLQLAKRNVERAMLENVIFKEGDGIDFQETGPFDLVFSDIAENHFVCERAYDVLTEDGYFVAHCLQSEQAKETHLAAEEQYSEVFTIESFVREYQVKHFGFRPKNVGILYTAYLVFARK